MKFEGMDLLERITFNSNTFHKNLASCDCSVIFINYQILRLPIAGLGDIDAFELRLLAVQFSSIAPQIK